jgi:hypothetical protein
MLLEVRRRMIPVGLPLRDPRSQWEQVEFDQTVWKYEGRYDIRPASAAAPPDGYVPGLLMCYVDGCQVPLDRFIAALVEAGLTFEGVEREITEAKT